jgi:hypothetical protein
MAATSKTWLGVVWASVFLTGAATAAHADMPAEVEAARANARAGGPTNAYDAELLRRYGALSGTKQWSRERMEASGEGRTRPRRKRVKRW